MPAHPTAAIAQLAQVAEAIAQALTGEWCVLSKPGSPGVFLSDGRRLLHLNLNRSQQRLVIRGVDPKRAATEQVLAVSAMTHGATVAVNREPQAIAKVIEARLLPGYDIRLAAAQERAEARAEALRTQERDIESLLKLVESGNVRTSFLDTRLVSWMIGETNASATIYVRREPGTVELTLQQVPLAAVRPIAEAVRAVLEGRLHPEGRGDALPTAPHIPD